jgi:hypothetical protein
MFAKLPWLAGDLTFMSLLGKKANSEEFGSGMRVLVFEPHSFGVPIFEMALDAIQEHLDLGHQVTWIGCNKDLLACESNLHHWASMCAKCVSRRDRGANLLTPRVPMTSLLEYVTPDHRKELLGLQTAFRSLDELRAYALGNLDLGEAVASTLIFVQRTIDLDVKANATVIKHLLQSAFLVYRSLQNYFDHHPTDRVYISNGRVAILRAAVRACEDKRVPFVVRDFGRDKNTLTVFPNTTSYDLEFYRKEIQAHWQKAAGDPRREQIATHFFVDRAGGGNILNDYRSFVGNQQPGLLPADWRPDRHNVAVFNSSEDEFLALGPQWKNPLYQNQLDGLRRLRGSLPGLPEQIHFTLRLHPNLKGAPEKHLRSLTDLHGPRFTVVRPDEPVSSYALLRACDKVLTFGSTMGIEAVFWGKPSILAGRCHYQDLGGTYNPGSHADLLEMLRQPLEPIGREAALMFGYYYATCGVPYKYCVFERLNQGRFKGRYLHWSRATHYLWAVVHRIPPLHKMIDRLFLQKTFRKIMNGVTPR